jgi:hypothetical protein
MFGPTPRDYVLSAVLLPLFFAGPLLMIFAINHYPTLDIRLLWVTAAFYVLAFAALFSLWKTRAFPDWVPAWARVAARAGLALSFTALVLGVFMIANGYATPLETRTAQVVRKEESRERDPSRRQYRLYVLAWPGSTQVTQIDSSAAVYNRVRIGDRVTLTLGKGRLGLEWVHGVQL